MYQNDTVLALAKSIYYIADKRLQFINWSLNNLDSSSLPQHHDSNRNSTASAASEASENARQSDKDGQEH